MNYLLSTKVGCISCKYVTLYSHAIVILWVTEMANLFDEWECDIARIANINLLVSGNHVILKKHFIWQIYLYRDKMSGVLEAIVSYSHWQSKIGLGSGLYGSSAVFHSCLVPM
jgi:hypothetical protein